MCVYLSSVYAIKIIIIIIGKTHVFSYLDLLMGYLKVHTHTEVMFGINFLQDPSWVLRERDAR